MDTVDLEGNPNYTLPDDIYQSDRDICKQQPN